MEDENKNEEILEKEIGENKQENSKDEKTLIKILLLFLQFYSDFLVTCVDPVMFKIGFFEQPNRLLTRIRFNRLVQTA